jgi:hypothetical protein
MTSSGSQGISSNESMGLRLNGFLCRPGGGPCRHPQIGISELRCGALRPSALSATASNENTPLFLFARPVKSAGLIVSLLLNRPPPLPSEPWQLAHFDRNSILPLSISCAQTQVIVAVMMQAKNNCLQSACIETCTVRLQLRTVVQRRISWLLRRPGQLPSTIRL